MQPQAMHLAISETRKCRAKKLGEVIATSLFDHCKQFSKQCSSCKSGTRFRTISNTEKVLEPGVNRNARVEKRYGIWRHGRCKYNRKFVPVGRLDGLAPARPINDL